MNYTADNLASPRRGAIRITTCATRGQTQQNHNPEGVEFHSPPMITLTEICSAQETQTKQQRFNPLRVETEFSVAGHFIPCYSYSIPLGFIFQLNRLQSSSSSKLLQAISIHQTNTHIGE